MRRVRTHVLNVLVVAFALVAAPAFARPLDGSSDHCTEGDVQAIENAFIPLLSRDFEADSDTLCQFRTFIEPVEGICFDDLDTFVGGHAFIFRSSDRDELKAAGEFLSALSAEFTVVGPGDVLFSTFATGLRGAPPDFDPGGTERRIWVQFGATFTGMAIGDYELTALVVHPDFGPVLQDEVRFTVLPHETAHDLGRPTDGTQGSVVCPSP